MGRAHDRFVNMSSIYESLIYGNTRAMIASLDDNDSRVLVTEVPNPGNLKSAQAGLAM